MKVSGFSPIAPVFIVAGLIAAVGSLLFIGNSPTVQADSTYNPTASVKYCNDLAADYPGNPYKIAMGVDAALAGTGPTCHLAPGEDLAANSVAAKVTLKYNIPVTDVNFAPPFVVNFIPSGVTINKTGDGGADGLGADIPVGEKVGGFNSLATLGVVNGACGGGFPVPFKLYNGALPDGAPNPRPNTEGGNSTNIAFPRNQGQADRNGAWQVGSPPANGGANNVTFEGAFPAAMATGATLAVTKYPSYLLDIFDPDGATRTDLNVLNDNVDGGPNLKPIVPIAVYIGMTVPTPASNDWIDLFFLQFGAGDLVDPDHDGIDSDDGFQPPHPLAKMTANLGQPNFAVLQDPSSTVGSVSSINDFCTPLTTEAMLLGTTPGGFVRAKNPAAAGTNFHLNWSMSYRDLDQDGRQNDYDACPHTASPNDGTGNPASIPVTNFPDGDGDLLHFQCDPNDAAGVLDFDADTFSNGQDNCPQAANTSQVQAEINQSYATAAPDHGPKTDQMGDLCEGAGGGEYGTVTFTQNGVGTVESGTAEGGTATTLTDNVPANPFAVGDLVGYTLFLTGGAGAGQQATITGNTATVITAAAAAFAPLPAAGTTYTVRLAVNTSDTVSNGRFHVDGNVIAKCLGGAADADGDGYCVTDQDVGQDAPAGPAKFNRHTGWSGGRLGLDTDGDGFGDFAESYNLTDGAQVCAYTAATSDESPKDNWPYDFDDQKRAALADVLGYIPVFNKYVTEIPAATARYDLTYDGLIGLADVLSFIPVFNSLCTTVVQQ